MDIIALFQESVREYHHADTPDKKALALKAAMVAFRMAKSRKMSADRVQLSPFPQLSISIAGRRYEGW